MKDDLFQKENTQTDRQRNNPSFLAEQNAYPGNDAGKQQKRWLLLFTVQMDQ